MLLFNSDDTKGNLLINKKIQTFSKSPVPFPMLYLHYPQQ